MHVLCRSRSGAKVGGCARGVSLGKDSGVDAETPRRTPVSKLTTDARLRRERLLLVIELDVRLVEEGDREVEREVAVGALDEGEAGVPAVQVALEPQIVLGE